MIAPDLVEQFPDLPGDEVAVYPVLTDPAADTATPPVVDPPVEPAPAAPTAEALWLRMLYTELSKAYGAQAARLAQYEEAEAKPPEPERWLPLKRGCGVCIPPLDYEWVRKRAGLGVFKTRREMTPKGKPGRIFIEVNSVSAYWQRINAK